MVRLLGRSAHFSGFPVGFKGFAGDKRHMADSNSLEPSPFNRHEHGLSRDPKDFAGLNYSEKVFNWLAFGHLRERVTSTPRPSKKRVGPF